MHGLQIPFHYLAGGVHVPLVYSAGRDAWNKLVRLSLASMDPSEALAQSSRIGSQIR